MNLLPSAPPNSIAVLQPPPALWRLARLADAAPFLRGIVAAAYRRYFNAVAGEARLFCGIHTDFAAAARAIPAGRALGYDNVASAQRLSAERSRIVACDYPVMFWLERLLPQCRRLFDWGGNVGISWYAYRKYLDYPAGFEWLVSDVPAVIAAGESLAEAEHPPGLRFTTTLEELADSDVLLAAGSLHFIEDPLADLRRQRRLPPHILINKLPAYALPAAVTLQNMGSAFCPNHLFNRCDFVGAFTAMGYDLIDEWQAPDLSCRIPLFPRHSIAAYSGFYFRRRAGGDVGA